MKKRLFPLLITLFTLLLTLAACSGDTAPLGMQTAADGSNGYRVYMPDDWVVVEDGSFLSSYISAMDTTGFLLSYRTLGENERDVTKLFSDDLSGLSRLSEYTLLTSDTVPVSGIDSPYAVYTHKDGETLYKTQLYYTVHSDRLYVLSFTAKEESFKSYEEMVGDVVAYVQYNDNRKPSDTIAFTDDKAPAGMKRASNPDIAKYRFYVPEDFVIKSATTETLVYVSESDKSSYSVFPTSVSASDFDTYLASYKAKLSKIYDSIQYVSESKEARFGERPQDVFMMEYTGVFQGESYRVRQHIMQAGYDIYIFTYTAKDTDCGTGETYFEKNLPIVTEIEKAFRFEGET